MVQVNYVLAQPSGEPSIGFADAAPLYLKNGLKPIPVSGKVPLVKGATGHHGVVTEERVSKWCKQFPAASVAIRADGFFSLDIDHHDDKYGNDQLLDLVEKYGPLPATISSTSRGKDSPSRQYFFRSEGELPLLSDPAPDIEIIQRSHRYSVVAPSIHPTTGSAYVWYGPDGQEMVRLPTIEDFAIIPSAWLKGLRRNVSNLAAHDGIYSGDIDDWINWLGTDAPWWTAQGIRLDIIAKQHIGHSDLLKFVYRIHATRLEGDNSLRPIFEELVHKFSTTTNNPQWQRELENAVRWTIGNSWSPLDPKNEEQ